MDKVFFSDITRSKTHRNDLNELCKVEPATPIINNSMINLGCDFNPRYDKHYIPKKKSKAKVRTVRDIRNQFEKDILVDLPSYLERQQNLLLRKIRDGTSKDNQTKVIANKILNSDEPISRASWQMLMNINPEGHAHSSQYIRYDGKPIRINGCRGGRNKFICNYNGSKEIKSFKNNLKKKSFFKKKYLLRNSVSVNFKPGPLSRKNKLDNSYQKYNVGDIELANLPKPGLEFQPSYGRSLDPMISSLINNFRDVNGRISEKWAEFAVSVLGSKNTLNYSNESPLIFDLNYKYNQRRILMRRDRDCDGEMTKIYPNSNMMEISEADAFDVIPEVRVMMNKMLDAVEISCNQDNMYASDDKPIKDFNQTSLNSSINNSTVKDKTKKKYCELDRLDVTVIRIPENEQKDKDLSVCKNSFCSLGCICDSLQSEVHLKSHCGRIDCMFECKCNLPKYMFISDGDYGGECSELLPGLINLEKEINYKLAKEEQKFHQTVIVSGNQSILLKSKRRNVKSSKKYADFYSKMCLKSDLNLSPILSLLINKVDCENIEPWCMVHNLYKCFCKGIFLEPARTEKISNENEKCTINQDKESLAVKACVSDDTDSLDKLRPRLRRDKCVEINSSVIDLDKEPDMEDFGSAFKSRSSLNKNTYAETTYYSTRSCARTKPYKGRKYSLGYYLNANFNIINLEKNDSNLRKRLESLVGASVNEQEQYDVFEKNTVSNKTTSLRSERLQKRKERCKDRENESAIDKTEANSNTAIKPNSYAAIEGNSNAAIELNSNAAVGSNSIAVLEPLNTETESNLNAAIEPNTNPAIEANSKEIIEVNPMDIPTDQTSSESSTEPSRIEMSESTCEKRISNKPQLVAWLESSYQQYKKREDLGIVKNTLEPPKKGKVLLYPWDFILSRYSERKNLFLISKNQPFRIFMAVDCRNSLFEHCINIDEIRFADLHKYPATVKNLLTNTSGLKDNFCILYGLPHCWELIGSVMKINDSKENTTKKNIENALSDEAMSNISYPIEEVFDQCTAQTSDSEAASSCKSRDAASVLRSPNKNTVSESSKWFVMTIEDDFSEIQFYNKGFFVKHESIMKAINVARVSGKTVRLSSQKCVTIANSPQFGIYAIPNASEDCVFVGPYETDESLGIETVKLVSQIRRHREKTRGVWIFTNKVDNLKVIDNPLSFMPSQDVQKNGMMPLDRVTTEDQSKMCNPETQTVESISQVPVIVTPSEKYIKTAKPIKIRKSAGICRITSSKSLLKISSNNSESMATENFTSKLIPISSELKSDQPSLSCILTIDPAKTVEKPPVVCEQKLKKPVAEVAPQIKIAAVYSEVVEKSKENQRPPGTMLVLKPEEINKRHFEKVIPKSEEPPSTSCEPENSETMDIEDYLESSNICTAPEDGTLIISDEEEESPIKEVWIECTNVDNLGLIPAKMNDEGQISFQFPGFKTSEFYLRETAFTKIQQVLSRKVYIPSNLNLEWDIIESKDKIESLKLLKTEDFSTDLVLTKQGLRHKTLVFKSSNDLKTYGRRKLQCSSTSNAKSEEFTDSDAPSPIPNESEEANALIKSIISATHEDRLQYAKTLESIMQENEESSLPSSELFKD